MSSLLWQDKISAVNKIYFVFEWSYAAAIAVTTILGMIRSVSFADNCVKFKHNINQRSLS